MLLLFTFILNIWKRCYFCQQLCRWSQRNHVLSWFASRESSCRSALQGCCQVAWEDVCEELWALNNHVNVSSFFFVRELLKHACSNWKENGMGVIGSRLEEGRERNKSSGWLTMTVTWTGISLLVERGHTVAVEFHQEPALNFIYRNLLSIIYDL